MRRGLILLSILFCAAGCSDVPHAATGSTAPVPATAVVEPTLQHGALRLLVNPTLADSAQLYVGDSEDQVTSTFHAPKDAYEFRELPPGFQQPYRASGFQNKSFGFGVIYYDSRVAQAMVTENGLTWADVRQTVDAYTALYTPRPSSFSSQSKLTDVAIPGVKVSYWFWDDSDHNQRFMICAVQDKTDPKKFDLTTAVGDDVAMDALRMKPSSALQDRAALERPANDTQPANSPRT